MAVTGTAPGVQGWMAVTGAAPGVQGWMAVTGTAPGVTSESILVSKASAFDLGILQNMELTRRD